MRLLRKRPEWSDTVLAVGTVIATIDVLARWALGAFDRTDWSTSVASTLLNALLVALATGGVSAAMYQRKKRRESDQFIIDIANQLPKAPEGPPILPDVTTYGAPALNTATLAGILADARARAEQTYTDARGVTFAMIANASLVPSIRVEFEFFSAHAGKIVLFHWDNYRGLCTGHPGQQPRHTTTWEVPPWDAHPTWERGYRLAYERAQPIPPTASVIVAAVSESSGIWHYGFNKGGGVATTYGLADDAGNVVVDGSVYIARLNVVEVIRGPRERSCGHYPSEQLR